MLPPTSPTEVSMRRIRLAVVLALSLLIAPLAGEAQTPMKIPVVGALFAGSAPSAEELAKSKARSPFWREMTQLGWLEGKKRHLRTKMGRVARSDSRSSR